MAATTLTSMNLEPPPPLPVPETNEDDLTEDLDAYFEACEASSSLSSSDSSSCWDTQYAEGEEENRKAAHNAATASISGIYSDATANTPANDDNNRGDLSPLQGSAPRPLLLLRQRHGSVSGEAAAPPLHDSTTSALLGSMRRAEPDHNPSSSNATSSDVRRNQQPSSGVTGSSSLQVPNTASGDVEIAFRGAAGRDLAFKLAHAALPLTPSQPAWCTTAEGTHSFSAAFDFHPLPASPTTAKGKRAASTNSTSATATTTTITTRGRSTHSASSTSFEARQQQHARQRAVLFDVLCAVRQHPTASCEEVMARSLDTTTDREGLSSQKEDNNTNKEARELDEEGKDDKKATTEVELQVRTWHLRDSVRREARAQQWPPCFVGALEQLLEVANHVAAVATQIELFERVCAAFEGDDADVQDAEAALEAAGLKALQRLARVLRHLHADFVQWVLQTQEYLVAICDEAFHGDKADRNTYSEARCRRSQLQSSWWWNNEDEEAFVGAAAQHSTSPRQGYFPSPSAGHSIRGGLDCVSGNEANYASTAIINDNEEYEEEKEGAEEAAARDGVLPWPFSLLDVVLAVQENCIPLQRCRTLVEESGCFDGLTDRLRARTDVEIAAEGGGEEGQEASTQQQRQKEDGGRNEEVAAPSTTFSATPPPKRAAPSAVSFAVLAARLLDSLIIQASALQDTSTMDLYRFYVMLLLYTSWPYVLLCTAAIFGFVRGIDPPTWRRQLPRLFRSSFSHVRIGDASRHYPTDVLSLLLNCVGYYNSTEAHCGDGAAQAESSAVSPTTRFPQPEWKPVKNNRAGVSVEISSGGGDGRGSRHRVPHHHHSRSRGSGKEHRDMSEHHVAVAALASARAFVLRSLASFTRRKKQVALSRTPARASAAGHFKRAKPEQQQQSNENSHTRNSTTQSATESLDSSTPQPWQNWQKKSVKEILHYIMYEAGGNGGDDDDAVEGGAQDQTRGVGATVVAYAQQNQDVRRRVVQLPDANNRNNDSKKSNSDIDCWTSGDGAASTDRVDVAVPGLTPDGKHFLYYPTTIPLGFATMSQEALPGQQTWQQEREEAEEQQHQHQHQQIPTPFKPAPPLESASSKGGEAWTRRATTSLLSSLRRDARLQRQGTSEWDDDDNDHGDGAGGAAGPHTSPLHRRPLSVWTLFIVESAAVPDVVFANANGALREERAGFEGGDDTDDRDAVRAFNDPFAVAASTVSPARRRRARHHQLWINVTIPCARWVTTALLIPIGVAVQRLQERRLQDLFAVSLQAVHPPPFSAAALFMSGAVSGSGVDGAGRAATTRRNTADGVSGLLWRNNEEGETRGDSVASPSAAAAAAAAPLHRLSLSRTPATPLPAFTATSAASCSFLQALKLLVDVALCRDQERVVVGFLERLYREPRWWARRWVDGGAGAFGRLGTASPAVSAIFADALRGKRLGELVRLVVLPAKEVRRERPSTAGGAAAAASSNSTSTTTSTPTPAVGGSGVDAHAAPAGSSISADMLDMFASFQLEFTFPGAFALILQPRDLSVYVQPVTNTTERSYQTFFWQRRRRLYVEEAAASVIPNQCGESSSTSQTPNSGVPFADVWSYIFGYQCSLYYAQITLREHKKQLHQRDTQDFQVAQTMGLPGPRVAQHLQFISRGLGSAYYTLNFAVDTLLSFTQGEAMRTVYDLERLLNNAMRSAPALHSCMELCHALDTLLLQLHYIAFPARPAVALSARERAMQSTAAEAVRSAVQRILEVALDPSRLPVSYISSTTRNAVEALVAAVTAAGERQSVLASRLHPLRVMLTFNKYYGTPEETLSYRFR